TPTRARRWCGGRRRRGRGLPAPRCCRSPRRTRSRCGRGRRTTPRARRSPRRDGGPGAARSTAARSARPAPPACGPRPGRGPCTRGTASRRAPPDPQRHCYRKGSASAPGGRCGHARCSTRWYRRSVAARRVSNLIGMVLPPAVIGLAVVLFWGRAVEPLDIAVLAVGYALTCLGITVGFHRLLTHRAFQTYPAVRYALAVLGTL